MKPVIVTQRVVVDPRYGERRDCLDQRWTEFLLACGLAAVPVPNSPAAAQSILETLPAAGVVLTGGNDLAAYGGDAPERDATENALLDMAERCGLPVLAVCRGMQMIQHRAGIPLRRVEGHVAPRQTVTIEGIPTDVNSFHNFGATETRAPFEVWAHSADGVIEAIRDSARRIEAIMWHPERISPFAERDIALFRRMFETAA